jgi:protein-disulfide isomerase
MMRQLCGVGAMCGLLLGIVAGPAAAEDARGAPDLPVERIEEIVRDYLLREPEVIYEALQELQRRQQVAATERQKAAIAANEALLFDDPATPFGGDADAQVTLVEFFDYRCGYCRTMAQGLRSLIGQDPKLRFVFKEMPILSPESTIAAKAAMAAAKQGKYAELHFALMQAKELDAASIMDLARKNGLDPQRLAADMEDPAIAAKLEENLHLAQTLGIDGTPSFVIGDQVIPGATEVTRLAEMIGNERKKVRAN